MALLLLLFSPVTSNAEQILKVGVYGNKPTIFMDQNGKPAGLFIDILEAIAAREDWQLQYVEDHFVILLNSLRKGDIDLLPGVAFTRQREEFIDYNFTTVMANWAELYTPAGGKLTSLKELDGKIVGAKQGDIHFHVLKEMVANFNISCRFFEADEYVTVFEMLQAKYVDVGVVNRLFGNRTKAEYDVEATPVIFNPIEMRFAVPKGRNSEVLGAIDAYMNRFKEDEASVYYKSINRWFVVDGARGIPGWLYSAMYITAAIALFLFGASLLFRHQVKIRTAELRSTNEDLQAQIEHRRQMEEKFREIARVIEASNDAVALLDRDHRHIFNNPAYQLIVARRQDDLQGKRLDEVVGKAFFFEVLDGPVSSCLRGRVVQVQTQPDHLSQENSFWNITLSPYYAISKEIEGYVIAIRDVTRQVELENSLKTAQKMEAIGTMASGVAHDLNNILAGVVSYPELIRRGLPPESPLEGPLLVIEQAGKRAAAVVGDLLTLARNAASVKEPIDTHELIKELLSSVEWKSVAARYPDVTMRVELDAGHAVVSCSQVHMRKSVMNLLHNAVEAAAPVGEVMIATANAPGEIASEQTDEEEDSGTARPEDLLISVCDDGPGIEAPDIEQVFEPFFTTKKMGRSGSGLGLSVVWSTISEHNGRVEVKNMFPGAMFVIRLPVAKEKAALPISTAFTLDDYKGKGDILIIDDEQELRDIAGSVVEMFGYSVTTAADGAEALACIRRKDFDLVMLDMILNDGMEGYEIYKRILELKPEQKAIIVSGYSTSKNVRKTLELGAVAVVKKPYTLEELGRVIQVAFKADGGKLKIG
jgi:PAS domain S-box-containing protein